ncbi:MAG TPA: hypothetical protein V6C96_01900, partial [Vampirovibrionales bacterium]
LPASKRVSLFKNAIVGSSCFVVDERELKRQQKRNLKDLETPSYTIETVEEIIAEMKAENPSEEIRLKFIIGSDAFLTLASWKDINKLCELCFFYVAPRHLSAKKDCETYAGKLPCSLQWQLLQTPFIDISSGLVRERIRAKMHYDYLLPSEIRESVRDLF